MTTFYKLINANSETVLAKINGLQLGDESDLIGRIDLAAEQMELKHTQLLCAIGFNARVRDLEEVFIPLGFRTGKLFNIRLKELFATDVYQQLSIDNLIDIYTCYSEPSIKKLIDELLPRRLRNLEDDEKKIDSLTCATAYRVEIHTLYNSRIIPKELAQKRMESKDLAPYRDLSSEIMEAISAKYYPASNLLFTETISLIEKRAMFSKKLIPADLIKNRLQNKKISEEERAILEDYL